MLLTIAILVPAVAQGETAVRSLGAIAVTALQADPRTEAIAARLDLAAADREQALAGYRPEVTLAAGAGRARYQLNGAPDSTRDPTAAGLNITQPVYDFGRTAAQVASATALLQSADAQSRAVAIEVVQDSATAALQVDLARHVLETVTQNEHVLSERLAYTRARFEAGDFTRTDVAQAEARYSGAQAQVRAAQAALDKANAALQKMTGRPVDVDLGDLPVIRSPATLAAALESIDEHPEL